MRLPSVITCVLVSTMAVAEEPASEQQRLQLKQAFDGAMTCSALAAIKSEAALGDEQKTWGNRSFAFGMFAAQVYSNLTGKPLSGEELGQAVNQYADGLAVMVEEELEPFEKGCAAKYEFADELCRQNECPYSEVVEAAPAVPAAE
ncbi:MAG: hypothetical protein AB7Q81_10025 [Gammaproteobacteria bacterium]